MLAATATFLMSVVLSDLAGYWLHRWAHRKSAGPLHRAHMTHHVVNYPPARFYSRKYRSSRQDSLAIWFAPFGLVYVLIGWLAGVPDMWAFVGGLLFVSIMSSIVHDLSHIGGSIAWRWQILRGAAVRHHTHHFKMGRNFGILLPWWDQLFRTRRGQVSSSR